MEVNKVEKKFKKSKLTLPPSLTNNKACEVKRDFMSFRYYELIVNVVQF